MADLKKRILHLNSGKQIKLYGESIAINQSLEIGEGCAPNILALSPSLPDNKTSPGLANPYGLTVEELMELADFNIQLWMDLKAGLRRNGGIDPRIFRQDTVRAAASDQEPSNRGRKPKKAVKESQ